MKNRPPATAIAAKKNFRAPAAALANRGRHWWSGSPPRHPRWRCTTGRWSGIRPTSQRPATGREQVEQVSDEADQHRCHGHRRGSMTGGRMDAPSSAGGRFTGLALPPNWHPAGGPLRGAGPRGVPRQPAFLQLAGRSWPSTTDAVRPAAEPSADDGSCRQSVQAGPRTKPHFDGFRFRSGPEQEKHVGARYGPIGRARPAPPRSVRCIAGGFKVNVLTEF